ncbi:MAG: hypothetical protein VB081_01120, partial [Christensenella sp.]|uniref:hypothetical protein n=1 Tax=Christensenella sp. TaxID=1935934 RepID=UPI002B213575
MGDRPFYEAYFTNSLNNQMKLAKVSEPTASMVEIATMDALENTYQDNNGYTKFVNTVRKGLNFGKDFGFGDIVIPFAKTPANLTKALVEFSPVGLVKSLSADAIKFNRAVDNGTVTPQMQRKFVNNIGKGVAGTLSMLVGAFLANAGFISGAGDDDKDAANFQKNVLGIQPYSVVLNGKSYSYDWAAPIGPQFAIAADIVQNIKSGKEGNFGLDVLGGTANSILNAFQTGGGVLFEQSFLRGIQGFFKEDNLMQAVVNTGLSVLGQYVPSLSNQIAQLTDPVQRNSYAYNNSLQTGINKAAARIPGLSQTLEPVVDVYGREVQRYGGENSVFNVMLNPANVIAENSTPAAEEVWRLYQETGNNSVFPSVAPYYVKYQSEKYDMTPSERTQYQKTMGQSTAKIFDDALNHPAYADLDDGQKAQIAQTVNEYSKELAKNELLTSRGVKDEAGNLYSSDKWIVEANESKNTAEYIMLKTLTAGIENEKDSGGKTVQDTASLKKKDIIDSLAREGNTSQYYDSFGVNKGVKSGNVTWDKVEKGQSGSGTTIIAEAKGYDVGNIKTKTLEQIANYGISKEDYAYVKDRLAGHDDKVKYLQDSGFKGEQLTGMVAMTVMGDTAKDKMTVAQEDMNIPNDVYVNTYITGYSSVGSKAERNKQIREYVDGLPNLTQEQKDALYNWNKVSRGKS